MHGQKNIKSKEMSHSWTLCSYFNEIKLQNLYKESPPSTTFTPGPAQYDFLKTLSDYSKN